MHGLDGGIRVGRSHSDGSYLSASDPRVWFGLGTAAATGEVWVRWASGEAERFAPPAVDHVVALEQGRGIALPVGEFEAAVGTAPPQGSASSAAPALAALQEAHRMLPGDAGVAVNLAVALQHLDRLAAARLALADALATDPQQPLANFNLGVIEAASGDDRAAIVAYEAALRNDPRLLGARFNLANSP